MDLGYWHARLERHFADLRKARQATEGDRPVFALEHGLDQTEREAVTAAVLSSIVRDAPSRKHGLPWIVYAAELGYRYSGDEYWQTFELETPGWTLHGDRNWIRDRFRWFHNEFGGAKPSGAWAEHFTIICWPITHAILPLDLQRQLARILYELRDSFSAELFESPSRLGEFVAARSWNATSRFQNLAQETQLVGQIAAALLLQGEFGTGSLLHAPTLRRISADLDRERRGRVWLRDARLAAQERARVRGLTPGWGPTSNIARRPEEARAEVVALGIEPRLVLRPTDATETSWEVLLEIPDLSHLLMRFPKTREVLTGSRCVVAGAAGRPLARGRCLHGTQRVALSRWPKPDEMLLQFEQTVPELDFLLRTDCLLRPVRTRLFRVASDGMAYESRSLRVRPGERYVLVRTDGQVEDGERTRQVVLNCPGADGAILDVPAALSADWEEALRGLGLGPAKTVEVWPAGLTAVVWDGEGHGEWLASERPCLAIRSDHSIASLVVSMTGGTEPPLELTSITPGVPVFVELPELPVGLHSVRIGTRGGPEADTEPLGELEVVMRIRSARPWSPGVSPHGPLLVDIEPESPTLEQLWEGRTEVTLLGPSGRSVRCRAALFETDAGAATITKKLPPIALPITPEGWRAHFEKHFRKAKDVQQAFDTARICELEFTADEFGGFGVRCERKLTPLRWAVRRHGHRHIVRLLDDTGSAEIPALVRLHFETPSVEDPLEPASEYEVPLAGGLYVARTANLTAAIVAPPTVRGFEDFGCVPRFDGLDRSVGALVRAARLARLWGEAKLPGDPYSTDRLCKVLLALASWVFRTIGGDSWAHTEAGVRRGTSGITDLARAVSHRRQETALGEALAFRCSTLATAAPRDRVVKVAELVTRFLSLPSPPPERVAKGNMIVRRSRPPVEYDPKWLSELALRLASDPTGVEVWAGEHLGGGMERLVEVPTLARAARFLVIATDSHLQSNVATGELYAGWRWN